jgi:hypothetical protein
MPQNLTYLLTEALKNGPSTAANLCVRLGISQPTFSRLIIKLKDKVLKIGKTRGAQYALIRSGQIPIYRISPNGKAKILGTLHAIHPKGFHFENQLFEDLPYFLEDLRPAGFLGRQLPRRHPELHLPTDIRLWTSEQCLHYLTRFGWNNIGDLILGEDAFKLYLQHSLSPHEYTIPVNKRKNKYPEIAKKVHEYGLPGSSAAGEQPKFIAERINSKEEITPVLVKFSPPVIDSISERVADLLICEHIALEVLCAHEMPAAKSELISTNNMIFLEEERFDRTSRHGRKGVTSLRALDLQFVGKQEGWMKSARVLRNEQLIDQKTYDQICWLETFGLLIANTDMHLANISFFTDNLAIAGLAPTYDMLPMFYSPQHNAIPERSFIPAIPTHENASQWTSAWKAALEFWKIAASDKRISTSFRAIAKANEKILFATKHISKF